MENEIIVQLRNNSQQVASVNHLIELIDMFQLAQSGSAVQPEAIIEQLHQIKSTEKGETLSETNRNLLTELINSLETNARFMAFLSSYKPVMEQVTDNAKNTLYAPVNNQMHRKNRLIFRVLIGLFASFALFFIAYTLLVKFGFEDYQYENEAVKLLDSESFSSLSVSALKSRHPTTKMQSVNAVAITNMQGEQVQMPSFFIDNNEVSVADFKLFIQNSGYVTDAEKEGWSYVADSVNKVFKIQYYVNWQYNAYGQKITDKAGFFPVVHVSYNDALAYANWKNKEIPTVNNWIAALLANGVNVHNSKPEQNTVLSSGSDYGLSVAALSSNVSEWCVVVSDNGSLTYYSCGFGFADWFKQTSGWQQKDKSYRCGLLGFRCITPMP